MACCTAKPSTATPLQPSTVPTACRAARDDPIKEEEEEYISNLCQCLCSCLMRPENKSKFLEVSSCGGARTPWSRQAQVDRIAWKSSQCALTGSVLLLSIALYKAQT